MADEKEESAAGKQKKSKKNKKKANLGNGNEKSKDLAFLNAATETGKRVDYGTNDTCELLESIPSQLVELKLDEVLVAVKSVDNLCKHERCKTKTNLMGLDCAYCNKRYCFKHGLPEVHGCTEAAKTAERKEFLRPKPLKTIRAEEELKQAKKRLNTKLKDMQLKRTQKQGDNTKILKK